MPQLRSPPASAPPSGPLTGSTWCNQGLACHDFRCCVPPLLGNMNPCHGLDNLEHVQHQSHGQSEPRDRRLRKLQQSFTRRGALIWTGVSLLSCSPTLAQLFIHHARFLSLRSAMVRMLALLQLLLLLLTRLLISVEASLANTAGFLWIALGNLDLQAAVAAAAAAA
eukprot:CAMPEP_0172738016 /NCGR_PEP_ID=MMETSP1074-20121228/119222_1 /TAXON_ID=2916 /ORGANISM="Ceratium fusus, Strain PA161109" /LENGTH=166 /DNA_ID=CAMNT_0013567559 /DNA_START=103 /DNA_END=599 /DNA_ORIENTATION=-